MKKMLAAVVLFTSTALASCAGIPSGGGVYETVMDEVISGSTAGTYVDLKGYREFAVLARFEGQPNAMFAFEIGHDNLTVVRENVQLNDAGWLNFSKTYPVFAPSIGIAVYNPPPNTKVRMTIYAGY